MEVVVMAMVDVATEICVCAILHITPIIVGHMVSSIQISYYYYDRLLQYNYVPIVHLS